MRAYREKSGLPVNIVRADRPGLSVARNAGINLSTGEVIVFTDDQLLCRPALFHPLYAKAVGRRWVVVGRNGQILPFNREDDPASANLRVQQRVNIPVRNFLPAGIIQGANMFFAREVFRRAGLFNETMGAGTPFACEDIEMATRASLQGFSGALLPELIVLHDHGRKRGSVEAEKTRDAYDYGRGAYYASFMLTGHPQIWELWARQTHARGPAPRPGWRWRGKWTGRGPIWNSWPEIPAAPPGAARVRGCFSGTVFLPSKPRKCGTTGSHRWIKRYRGLQGRVSATRTLRAWKQIAALRRRWV